MKTFVPPSESNVRSSLVFLAVACLFVLHVEIPVPGGTKQRELVPCLAANDDEVALKLAVISESLGRPKRSPASLRQAFLPNAIFFWRLFV